MPVERFIREGGVGSAVEDALAAQKGAANGIAPLDAALKVPNANLKTLSHTHPVDELEATGVADSSTYLRGDGIWETPAGGAGTPASAWAVNVLDYTVNGAAETDFSTAIQAAVDALTTSNTRGGAVVFPDIAGPYSFTTTIDVSAKQNVRFYSPGRAVLDYQGATGTYAIYADLSLYAPQYVGFHMENIYLNDTSGLKTRHGIYLNRVLKSRFVNCTFKNFNRGVTSENNSNLNTYDKCVFSYCTAAWSSPGTGTNNNLFLNCDWNNNSGTAYDGTGSGNNIFFGGDFEPSNAFPMIITGGGEEWYGTRIERNDVGEWIRVQQQGCTMALQLAQSATLYGSPPVNILGVKNRIELYGSGGGATTLVAFGPDAAYNEVYIQYFTPTVSAQSIINSKPTNMVSNVAGTSTRDRLNPAFPTNLITMNLSDGTAWTRTNVNLSIVGQVGGMDIFTFAPAVGGTVAKAEHVLPTGTYENLYFAISGKYVNTQGKLDFKVNGVGQGEGRLLGSIDQRTYTVLKGPFTDPTISIETIGTQTNHTARIWGLTVGAEMWSAG